MSMRLSNVWAAVTVLVAVIACVTILAATGSASQELLTWLASSVVPTVTIILVGGQLAGQVSEVKGQVSEVRDNVNGRMSELIASATGASSSTSSATSSAPDATATPRDAMQAPAP